MSWFSQLSARWQFTLLRRCLPVICDYNSYLFTFKVLPFPQTRILLYYTNLFIVIMFCDAASVVKEFKGDANEHNRDWHVEPPPQTLDQDQHTQSYKHHHHRLCLLIHFPYFKVPVRTFVTHQRPPHWPVHQEVTPNTDSHWWRWSAFPNVL